MVVQLAGTACAPPAVASDNYGNRCMYLHNLGLDGELDYAHV